MTREESYSEGWNEGRRRAEADLMDGSPVGSFGAELREWVARGDYVGSKRHSVSDIAYAWKLGLARGYRDTIARFERGEISWECFEQAPLGT